MWYLYLTVQSCSWWIGKHHQDPVYGPDYWDSLFQQPVFGLSWSASGRYRFQLLYGC